MSEQQVITDNSGDVDINTLEDPVAVETQGADDFFNQLDRQVMGSTISEETTQTTSPQENPVESSSSDDEVATLEKRYSDSSREAKRLNNQLRDIEPYLPILDAMKEDPNLISHVKDYFEGGGSTPTDLKGRLGIDEDMVFDYDDAVSNPSSDSAKLFNATVDGVVQKRLGQFANDQQVKDRHRTEERNFRSKYDISDGDYDSLVEFAKNRKLTLEDVYYLKNRESAAGNAANSARNEVMDQMKNVRKTPQSLASVGTAPREERSLDDQVFDQLLGVGERLDDIGL